MHISDQVYVLADHTKFDNHWGTTVMCELKDISCLITDHGITEPALTYYADRVPRLLIAPV
jgi:DeoR/GlpR family transcriptional regulator of sugar metabolism